MRVMAIDYGDARTGVAVSDALGILAGETFVIAQRDARLLAQQVMDEARTRGVETIVLGLPKNMDGTEGPRAEKARQFGEMLAESGIPLVLWDERRTTVEAHAILHANGKKMKNHKKNVDAVAAALILEGYLGRI